MIFQTRSSHRLSRGRRSVCPSPSPIKATRGLPNPKSLTLHKYKPLPEYGDQLRDLTYNAPRVTPRDCDFVVDPADWTVDKRGYDLEDLWDNDTGAPQGANTVETILGADIDGYQCEVCDELGEACLGKECIPIYKALLASIEAKYLEIRRAGIMGMGVFAKQNIRKGAILCEYTGRLFPLNPVVFPRDSSYTWHVNGTCRVDSVVYGNIGRFVNHHCTKDNCDPVNLMYGRRKVLAYQAKRAIAEGEQLYVNYGVDYFTPSKPCLCTAVEFPHLLGSRGQIRPAPTTARKSATVNTKNKNRSRSSSRETKLNKSTTRAGVVARSKL